MHYSVLILTVSFVVLGGCQAYQPLQLDLAAHEKLWASHDPSSTPVQDFAGELSQQRGLKPEKYDPLDGLSIAEAEVVALFFNAALRTRRLEAGVSLAGARESGRWEDPSLSADAGTILESISHPWIVSVSIGFTIPLSGRLGIEESKAYAEHRFEWVKVIRDEWETLCDLRSEWYALETIRRKRVINTDYSQRLESASEIAQRLVTTGEIKRAELRIFQLEQFQARTEGQALEREYAKARLRILELLGLKPDVPIKLDTTMDTAVIPPDNVVETAVRQNLSLAVSRAAYEAVDWSLRLEIQKQYPDLRVGPGFGNEDGQSRIELGLGIPIPSINLNKRGIAEAQASRLAAKSAYETQYERLVSSIARTEIDLAQARQQRIAVENEYIPLADAQISDTQTLANLGDFDALLQLDAIARQREAKLLVLESIAQEAQSSAALLRLLGPPLTPSLPLGE